MNIFQISIRLLLMSMMIFMGKLHGITRDDRQVFDTWISGKESYLQHVFADVTLQTLQQRNADDVQRAMLSRYKQLKKDLKDFNFYFNTLLHGQAFEDNVQAVFEHTKKLYPTMQDNVHEFLGYLIKSGFATTSIDRKERKDQDSDDSMNKYLALTRLFCADQVRLNERRFLFSLANNFFEYCFSPQTYTSFRKLLMARRYHPIARLLYSTMWSNLAGEGWKEWHESCLKNLKHAADQGKTVVYIAGGCDIYQLIKHRIYNIRVIDPMLPTQPAYYAQHWNWFVKKGKTSTLNNSGDRLQFTFDDGSTYMERTAYEQKGFFTFTDNKKKKYKIPQSKTTWSVYSNNQLVGTVVFDRRYCRQKDFEISQDKQLLMSFNELYYITSTQEPDHWGIFPSKFNKNISVLVKQLRRPLSKAVMCNMAKADKLPFEFIRLGTCAVSEDD